MENIPTEVLSEISEVESLLAAATYPSVKAVLQTHLNKLNKAETDRQQREIDALKRAADLSSQASAPVERRVISGPSVSSKGAFVPIENYAWDQGEYNSPTVSIFIDLEGVGTVKDRVEASFTKTSFSVTVTDLNGKNYRLVKDNLEKDIVPDKCKCIVKNNKIVLKLQKIKGEYSFDQWTSLTNKKKKTDNAGAPDAKKDPMGGIMDMMKDMYEDGDENMKKIIGEAMLKSRSGEKPDAPAMPDF